MYDIPDLIAQMNKAISGYYQIMGVRPDNKTFVFIVPSPIYTALAAYMGTGQAGSTALYPGISGGVCCLGYQVIERPPTNTLDHHVDFEPYCATFQAPLAVPTAATSSSGSGISISYTYGPPKSPPVPPPYSSHGIPPQAMGNPPSPTPPSKPKCTCSMQTIMSTGCNCGGK